MMHATAIPPFAPPERPPDEESLLAGDVLLVPATTVNVACRAAGAGAAKLSDIGLEQFTTPFVCPQHCQSFAVAL
jgi:hypothetical protein